MDHELTRSVWKPVMTCQRPVYTIVPSKRSLG